MSNWLWSIVIAIIKSLIEIIVFENGIGELEWARVCWEKLVPKYEQTNEGRNDESFVKWCL